ncbi:RagB/SusD family nutrient uptake outer membrane protein [Sphingobacterium paucimobilis]|uniref:SusD-like N-terminal domain-containing protein n=1 Tax=Sphingobacterium paucimobilis HER1398 TaxID=1346330 RepID=U2HUA6_9SPHI|nr:RagB/SusD family nutrient uptake outer membrane protein [Sphingobacterium paucimobilis]ERJ58870.1 hypothetical protein M472_08815 [Sphingobacterium paucimobilis HER1398]
MKLLKSSVWIISIMGGCLFSACESFLAENPDMRVTLDDVPKIRELLTNAYAKGSYVAFTESASDNAEDKGPIVVENPVNANPWKFQRVNSSGQDSPNYFWIKTYQAIAAANIAIEAYNNLPVERQIDPSVLGEAFLTRAFNHFMLVTLYAAPYDPLSAASRPGIPYVTEAGKKVITKYDRTTVAEVYARIETDLQEGMALIDDSKYKIPKFHFNRAAAYAFATRFYLFKQDYAKSATYGEEALGLNLTNHLRPINTRQWRNLTFNERLQYFGSVDNPSNLLLIEVESYLSRSSPGYRYGLTTASNQELFWNGNVTGDGVYGYILHGNSSVYNHAKWNEHFVYSGLQASSGNAYVTHPALTVDEMLLNRAESYAYLEKYDQAIEDLNQFASKKIFDGQQGDTYSAAYRITSAKILNYYETTDLKYGIVQAVLDFKRREFLFEGLRYFDILRYQIPVLHRTLDNNETYILGPNDPRRAFQMPEEVVLSGIQNNPINQN